MKQVNRINQFLLKNYPLIWNTKLVWLMLAGLFFHVMFFGLGFLNLNDPSSLQDYKVVDNFFTNGGAMLNMLISTILIVGWLFLMFKNNGFKSFYPTSRSQLFKQFVLYFIIIVFNISYFYSFFYGMKAFVNLNHPSLLVEKDIEAANHAAPFFSHHLDRYEINNKRYPLYLSDLFCETNDELINFNKPHFSFLEEDYQFYTLYEVEKNRNEISKNNFTPVFTQRINDSIFLYHLKDTVIDVSKDIPTAIPSYHNYSDVFFSTGKLYEYDFYTEYPRSIDSRKDSIKQKLVLAHHALLAKNNPSEIKNVLSNLLTVANKYKIKTDLKTEDWFSLIHTDSFEIKNLIRTSPPPPPHLNRNNNNQYQNWDSNTKRRNSDAYDENGNRIKTIRDEYIANLQTDFYLESDELRRVFSNINEVKRTNPFEDTIHFFMWFPFFLSSLIFAFRISGLRSIIFSAITVGVLCVLLALVIYVYEFFVPDHTGFIKIENFMAVFTWVIGTAILSIPLFYLKKTNKMISSIAINISFTFFALYIFLILVIISIVQDYYCDLNYLSSSYSLRKEHCNNILKDIGIYWSYILFVVAFVFLFFFSSIIRKWRALPESK
ncbi:MAG: hypothetical protein AB8F94_28980 [Saprospiraceae bacterium]